MNEIFEIVKYLLPLFGVFIGWLLTRKSENERTLKEDKKRLKRTLYYLLELRYQLKLSEKDDEFIQIYLGIMKEKLGQFAQPTPDQITRIIELLKDKILTYKPHDSGEKLLTDRFMESVDNLSEIEPVLAYRLNGKQNLKKLIDGIENVSLESLLGLGESKKDLDNAIAHFRPKYFKEALNELDSIIIEVAEKIDKKTLSDTQHSITDRDIHEKQIEIYQRIEKLFEGTNIKVDNVTAANTGFV